METRSASAVAQETLTAGGTLQTVEGKEEGAVALRVICRFGVVIVVVVAVAVADVVVVVAWWWCCCCGCSY